MKLSFSQPVFCAVVLAVFLPSGHTQSQLAPVTNPLAQIQALQTANEELLKRQDATLKDLSDMTTTANEVRILSRRG